jgi:hypothetical protein
MDRERRTKIRKTVKKISADMKKDPDLRRRVKKNPIRVLAEKGGLNLDEIIQAHDMWCEGTTGRCTIALSLTG